MEKLGERKVLLLKLLICFKLFVLFLFYRKVLVFY